MDLAGSAQGAAAPVEISDRDGAQVALCQRHHPMERFPMAFRPPVQQLV